MEETNSEEESLYNLLLADCNQQRRGTVECRKTRMKCSCRTATLKTKDGAGPQRELSIQCEPLPSLLDVSAAAAAERLRKQSPADDKCYEPPPSCRKDCCRSPAAGRRSCKKWCCGIGSSPPPPPPPSSSSQLACCVHAAAQWLRAVMYWVWDKKWHFFVAAAAFALGVYFEDYCQCYAKDECRYA